MDSAVIMEFKVRDLRGEAFFADTAEIAAVKKREQIWNHAKEI